MRGFIVLAALMVSSSVFGQECIRPEWGKCVSFPNGGSHTGMSIQKEKIQVEVTPGPDICVINEEEIGGYTFARFGRNGAPWRTQTGPPTSTISVSSRSEWSVQGAHSVERQRRPRVWLVISPRWPGPQDGLSDSATHQGLPAARPM